MMCFLYPISLILSYYCVMFCVSPVRVRTWDGQMYNRRKRSFLYLFGIKKITLCLKHCLIYLSILSTCHTEFTID